MLPKFNDTSLLEKAFTHRSALNEPGANGLKSNERLEFLGDAVLELATTNFLFNKYPNDPEGELTAYRSALVKTTTLATTAEKIGLGEKIVMSKGEETSGGRKNRGLLANTFEAVIGAIYLDKNFEAVVSFLEEHLFIHMDEILTKGLHKDPKSNLQEIVQAEGLSTPEYIVINEEGPDHEKMFTVEVKVNKTTIAVGSGKSKQEAQQQAAEKAIAKYPPS